MNRTDRLVAMVMHLQGRRLVRAEELAEKFEVSVRTVYRDVAALSEAGVPVAGEAGVGYSLVPGYHLPPVMLTADEVAALFVGGEMVKQFTDASLSAPIDTAIDKLRAVLPRDRQEHVERLARQTVVVGRAANSCANPEAQPWLLAVQRGIAQRRVLRITYRGRERPADTARDVEPLGAVCHRGVWYLVAWCRLRGDFRHFRIDRIQTLEGVGDSFAVRADFSLQKYLKVLAERAEREELVPVRAWFAQAAQERAHRECYTKLVPEKSRDGGAEFTLATYSLDWMARWLLSFGAEAEAIAPAALRQRVGREAEKVAQAHRRQRS